jgi:hypothetical protein
MAGKQKREPKPATEKKDRKETINGFEMNPAYEKKGMFLEECFEILRGMIHSQIDIIFPAHVPQEERTYIVDRLRAVLWAVEVHGGMMRVIHIPRRSAQPQAADA